MALGMQMVPRTPRTRVENALRTGVHRTFTYFGVDPTNPADRFQAYGSLVGNVALIATTVGSAALMLMVTAMTW